MKQTFGSFIKEKRIHKMLKLNAFAKQIGISPVYLSYIENGKRPAPSDKVIKAIISKLGLTVSETERLLLLAAVSRSKPAIPDDIIEYVYNHEYILAAIRSAKEHNVSDMVWQDFIIRLETEHIKE